MEKERLFNGASHDALPAAEALIGAVKGPSIGLSKIDEQAILPGNSYQLCLKKYSLLEPIRFTQTWLC